MSRPRWKYLKAKDYADENPVSEVYKQMQCLPFTKSFFSQAAVIVQADADQSDLLNRACFGRPILIGPRATLSCSNYSGNRSPCQENVPGDMDKEVLLFELGFEEAFFLSYELRCLQVWCKRHQEEVRLTIEELWQQICLQKKGFSYHYMAYSHLRRKNWIIRAGLQYGCHYIAYRHHPAQVHAEYSVIVIPDWEKQAQISSWSHMQGIIRLCGNVAKTLLLLHVTRREAEEHHPSCLECYAVKEMEVNRWLPQKHRMECQVANMKSSNENFQFEG